MILISHYLPVQTNHNNYRPTFGNNFFGDNFFSNNFNIETEDKINSLVTLIQRFVTQSKLSLIFSKNAIFFLHKTDYFWNNSLTHTIIQMATQSFK